MDKNFVLNGNKLIAEFMGFEYNEIDYIKKDMIKYGSSSIYTKEESYKYHIPTVFNGFINSYDGYMDFSENSKKENCYNYYVKNMGFHESYDWLMPVLNKIGIITNDYYYEKQHLFQDYYLPELDIKEVYYNVIEFIEWYNENK